jgi:HEAT repeat protein
MKPLYRQLLTRTVLLGVLLIAPALAQAAEYDGQTATQWAAKLTDDDKQVRRLAAYALGQIGPEAAEAVPALVIAADDNNIEVGWYSLEALGRIGPAAASAVPDVVRILKAAEQFRNSPGYGPLRVNGVRALGRIRTDSAAAISLLESTLSDTDRHVAIAATIALWQIDARGDSIESIGAELASENDDIALAAAMALVEIGEKAEPAAKPLIRALGHENADVRRAASRALSEIGLPAAPLVTKALEFPDRFDSVTAINTLGWMLEKTRRQVLHSSDTDLGVFIETATELQEHIVGALIAALDDSKAEIPDSAARALARLGPTLTPPMLKPLRDADGKRRDAVIAAFTQMERYLPPDTRQMAGVEWIKEVSLSQLVPILFHDDAATRRAAFRLFDALKYEGEDAEIAVGALRQGLRDQDVPIRRYAARSLERIQGKTEISKPKSENP